MTWGDESWQQAARDYQAGRKHGRHEGTIQMELGREVPQAEIIPLRNTANSKRKSDRRHSVMMRWRCAFSTSTRTHCGMSQVWESGSGGMASVGVSTRD
jgi:hypothetical protein